MKRLIIVTLVGLFAVPITSFAGTATSRWDLTLGGYIKFDMGYSSQGVNADYSKASRASYGSYENSADEYGSLFAAGGETRLNFRINGPDAWGAKTMGFVEGDFRGQSSAGDYGEFSLRHAYMRLKWTSDALTIGHTWQKWGYLPNHSGIMLGAGMLTAYNRGSRQPQIMWDHDFNKNVGLSLGIASPTNTLGSRTIDDFNYSGYPFLEGELKYTSDACGKIGSWQTLFTVSGFYGWERKIYDANPDPAITTYDDSLERAWGLALKGYMPVIPERKGNKTGALGISGKIFMSQNPSWYMGSFALGAYNRGSSINPDYSYPRLFGAQGHVSYWLTNNLFITGYCGQMRYTVSDRYKTMNRNAIQREDQYIVNLSYDINQAMRVGIEWDYIKTKYANYSAATVPFFDNYGKMHAFRIGAWYFF